MRKIGITISALVVGVAIICIWIPEAVVQCLSIEQRFVYVFFDSYIQPSEPAVRVRLYATLVLILVPILWVCIAVIRRERRPGPTGSNRIPPCA